MREAVKPNYYEVLQLQPYANPALVLAAYRILSKLYHPDTAREQANIEDFRLLQLAYETLSDPQKRMEYDHELRMRTPDGDSFQGFENSRPDPDFRDPAWESVYEDARGEYVPPSEEDLEFYKNLYNYNSGGKRFKAVFLIALFTVLMMVAIGFGILGFINAFDSEQKDPASAIIYFSLALLFLILAQVEAYYS